MADDKLHIRLHVYDAELSVNVPREDEEYYRSAAKLITDTINTYSTLFKGKKGDKDIIYMAMLDIALRYKKKVYVMILLHLMIFSVNSHQKLKMH